LCSAGEGRVQRLCLLQYVKISPEAGAASLRTVGTFPLKAITAIVPRSRTNSVRPIPGNRSPADPAIASQTH